MLRTDKNIAVRIERIIFKLLRISLSTHLISVSPIANRIGEKNTY